MNQVRVVFATDVLPLDPTTGAPAEASTELAKNLYSVTCSPAVQGAARWDDGKTWIYEFSTTLTNDYLPTGTSCRATLNEGAARNLSGTFQGSRAFQFSIDGPSLIGQYPSDPVIVEDQVFIAIFDQVLAPQSLAQVKFLKAERASSIGAEFLAGDLRLRLLEAAYRDGGLPWDWKSIEDRILVFRARERFAPGERVTLRLGAGLRAATGSFVRQRNQDLPLRVRHGLTASFACPRENAQAECNPILGFGIGFSARISAAQARQFSVTDGTTTWRPTGFGDSESSQWVTSVQFAGPFPPNAQLRLVAPERIVDDYGRPLTNPQLFSGTPQAPGYHFETAGYPPLVKFSAPFGIVEAELKPVRLPIALRSLEAQVLTRVLANQTGSRDVSVGGAQVRVGLDQFPRIVQWMRQLASRDEWKSRDASIFSNSDRQNASQILLPLQSEGRAFEVVGIPLNQKGFHVLEVESRILGRSLLGRDSSMFVPSSALVTNLAAHLKLSDRENSLVWVTSLDRGQPVSGATVGIHNCAGVRVWSGQTNEDGVVLVGQETMRQAQSASCGSDSGWSRYNFGVYATAAIGDDFTFVHSSWQNGIEAYRYGINTFGGTDASGLVAHTILDRPMFRAGQKVSMKHILRREAGAGFAPVAEGLLPNKALILFDGGDFTEELALVWDKAALVATSEWTIPTDAKLGSYTVRLVRGSIRDAASFTTANFTVDEFKVPLMTGLISVPTAPLVGTQGFEAQLNLSYLRGGPAAAQQVEFRHEQTRLAAASVRGFRGFVFATEPVRIGSRSGGEDEAGSVPQSRPVAQRVRLSAAGTASVQVAGLPLASVATRVETQMEYRDPNGESHTIGRTVDVWPASRIVGIHFPDWLVRSREIGFKVAVAKPDGTPVPSANVQVRVFRTRRDITRPLITGGLYGYRSVVTTSPVSVNVVCGATDVSGQATCRFTSPVTGSVQVQAQIADEDARVTYAVADINVLGPNSGRYQVENSDRIDLVPERAERTYEPGEIATLEVRSPFPQAVALVTTEREGVLSYEVKRDIGTGNPRIQVPISAQYSPNVYVSALVVSGRVDGDENQLARDEVDLGRPSFKLGIAALKVNWRPHVLAVEVRTDKQVYDAQEEGVATITVRLPDGSAPRDGTEFAFAIVDEGLLTMRDAQSWNILERMMRERPYRVVNATAGMQVVGKRHYGLKAVAHGGGGGQQTTRELFDTLIKWEARARVDANGVGRVRFKTNDSLTKFRVVAIATSGLNRFGSGMTSFQTSKDLIVQPAVPELARNGDAFDLSATVQNTTGSSQGVTVSGRVTFFGPSGAIGTFEIPPQALSLGASESSIAGLGRVEVPKGAVRAEYTIVAISAAGKTDRIVLRQTVASPFVARTVSAVVRQIDRSQTLGFAMPANAVELLGGVGVTLASTLGADFTALEAAMNDRVFISTESQVSKAVVSGLAQDWTAARDRIASNLDSDGLLKFFPESSSGSVALTAYALSIAKQSGLEIAPASEASMVGALRRFLDGRLRPRETDVALRLKATEAVARYGRVDLGWLASVRSIPTQTYSNAMLLDALSIEQFARGSFPGLDLEGALAARLTLVGSRLVLDQARSGWIHLSSPDTEAARALTITLTNDVLKARWRSQATSLMLGLIARQGGTGHWDTGPANAHGVVATKAFSTEFERTPVSGATSVAFGSQSSTLNWTQAVQVHRLEFPWPSSRAGQLVVAHGPGDGKPWLTAYARAALDLRAPLERGFTITKSIDAERRAVSGQWTVGDVVKVTLKIKGRTDGQQIALRDPIPAGSRVRRAPGSSEGASNGGSGWTWPTYEQFPYDGYYAYYESITGEEFEVSYMLDLNYAGTFKTPATRIEAVYYPETFAEVPNQEWVVNPRPTGR